MIHSHFPTVTPTAVNVTNVPPVINQLGPFEAVIRLASSPFQPDFSAFDAVASSATCRLDNLETAAAYFAPDASYPFPTVRCFVNATTWGQKYLLYSLDGYYLFRVPSLLSFVQPTGGNVSAPVPSPDVGVPLFGLDSTLSLSPPARKPVPLPADVRNCVRYDASAAAGNANLTNFTLDQGALSPPLASNTTNYKVTGNDPKSAIFGFALTPAAPGANASVDYQTPVSVTGSPIATFYYRAALAPGSNSFTIRVTAANGFTQNVLYVYVASAAAAVLTNLTADAAALVPPFAPGIYDYTLPVDPSVTQVALSVATNGSQYSLRYAPAVFDPAQTSVVFPSTGGLAVGIQAAAAAPSNQLCQNYTTSPNASKPLLLGGWGIKPSTQLPYGSYFYSDAPGFFSTTLALDCVGAKVFYVWDVQIDATAVLYTIAVKRGLPADLTPALSFLDVASGGSSPSPAYNVSNPPQTVYSIVASSVFQQLVLAAQPAAPVVSVRTVPANVTLRYGHNNFSVVLTGLNYVSKASYYVDAVVPSGVLAQILVQTYAYQLIVFPGFPGAFPATPTVNYYLSGADISPAFQGSGPFNYSVNTGDASQSYVLLSSYAWDAAATANLTCVSGCSGPLKVTDPTWLSKVYATINNPGGVSNLTTAQWPQRTNVWALGIAYGVSQVRVKITGSLGDTNTYNLAITRPNQVPDDATLTLVNVTSPDGSRTFGPLFSPATQSYNVSLASPTQNLLFSILTNNPSALVAMSVDGVSVSPSQISASFSPPAPTNQTLIYNLAPLPAQRSPPATYWQWTLPFGNATAGVVTRVVFNVTSGSAQNVYTYWMSVSMGNDASLSGAGYYLAEGTKTPIALAAFTRNGNQLVSILCRRSPLPDLRFRKGAGLLLSCL